MFSTLLQAKASKENQNKHQHPPQPKEMSPNQNLQTLLLLQHLPLVIIQNLSSPLNIFALNIFLVKFHQNF